MFHGLHHGLQRSLISSLAAGAPPPPPSMLTLVSAGLLLSHILSLLFLTAIKNYNCPIFFSFLNMLWQRCSCHSLVAWYWPAARPPWNWLALALLDVGESIWQLLTENKPFPSLLPKPSHTRPVQKPKRKGSVYGLN